MNELEKILKLNYEEKVKHYLAESWRSMAGESYHPKHVVVEYVLNSIDEISILINQGKQLTKEQKTVHVEVHRNVPTPYIKVSDNLGVFTESSLRGIVDKTGHQEEKKQKKRSALSAEEEKCLNVFGWRGVGAHCYRVAFPAVAFVTRPEGSKNTLAMRIDKPIDPQKDPRPYALFTKQADHLRNKVGTDAYLLGNIEHGDWTRLLHRGEKLAQDLGEVFRPFIEKGIVIEVTDGKYRGNAKLPKFTGVEFYGKKFNIDQVDVKGTVEVVLYYNPDKDLEHRVQIRNHGMQFHENIASIPQLNVFPFGEGALTGYVDENICKWSGNKRSIDPSNPGEKVFLDTLLNVVVPEIAPMVKARMRERSELEQHKLYQKVNEILRYIVHETDLTYDGNKRKERTENGEDENEKRKVKPKVPHDKTPPKDGPEGPAVPKIRPLPVQLRDTKVAVIFDADSNLAKYNTLHPDFITEQTAGREQRYVAMLVYDMFLQNKAKIAPSSPEYPNKIRTGYLLIDRYTRGEIHKK